MSYRTTCEAPLRSIGSFTELIRRRYQGQLDAGVARMNALIRDLLAYSRAGESEADSRKPVSVKESLQEALGNLQAATALCGATVTQDESPTILYNPRQLTQVFQNLIGNALKYRRQVEPQRIYISVDRRLTDWVFSVRDNGIATLKRESAYSKALNVSTDQLLRAQAVHCSSASGLWKITAVVSGLSQSPELGRGSIARFPIDPAVLRWNRPSRTRQDQR